MTRRTLFSLIIASSLAMGCASAGAQEPPEPEEVEEVALPRVEVREAEPARLAELRAEMDRSQSLLRKAQSRFRGEHLRNFEREMAELHREVARVNDEVRHLLHEEDFDEEHEEVRERQQHIAELRQRMALTKVRVSNRRAEQESRVTSARRALEMAAQRLREAGGIVGQRAEWAKLLDNYRNSQWGVSDRLRFQIDPVRIRALGALGALDLRGRSEAGHGKDRVHERLAAIESAVRELHELLGRHGRGGEARERAERAMRERRAGGHKGGKRGPGSADNRGLTTGVVHNAEGARPATPREPAALDELRRRMAEQQQENAALRTQLEDLRRNLDHLSRTTAEQRAKSEATVTELRAALETERGR